MTNVLIITFKKDDHADVVAECLIRKGANPIKWFPDEFLLNQRAIHKIKANGEHSIIIEAENSIDLMDIDVVWYRRARLPLLPQQLNPLDREVIEAENRMHMRALWLTLGKTASWINPLSSFDKSNSKIFQLREAGSIGLTIPETLITNDKKAIVEFLQKNKKGTVYKTFLPTSWEEGNAIYSCYTTAITTDMLPSEDSLSLTPGIFQAAVKKSYEIRITFLGNECIAAKIHNSEESDWRVLFDVSKLKISPVTIPDDIQEKCKLLMKKLGIVFGCFDFIMTPEGEYVFLEVNEMGQFLWIEDRLPQLNLLDMFCEFLLSYSGKKKRVSHKIFALKEISPFLV